MQLLFRMSVALLTMLLVACDDAADRPETPSAPPTPQTGTAVDAPRGTMLLFRIEEKGLPPYQTRMVVSADYVRIDDDEGPSDFVLYDRRSKVIYSSSSEEQTVLVVRPREIGAAAPIALDYAERHLAAADPRQYEGRPVQHYRFITNDEICYEAYTVAGFLIPALDALREYRLLLAGEHAAKLARLPQELVRACDLAHNIYAPTRHLQFGFPVREWNARGYQRVLIDFDEDFILDPALFQLPPGYEQFTADANQSIDTLFRSPGLTP